MNRPRLIRGLRIAWSVWWLIVLVLLLPDVELSRGAGSTLVLPSRMILPILFSLPLIAAIPWIPTRFRLRTLLIVTTAIAVILGLVVYATR